MVERRHGHRHRGQRAGRMRTASAVPTAVNVAILRMIARENAAADAGWLFCGIDCDCYYNYKSLFKG